jgi:glutaminase
MSNSKLDNKLLELQKDLEKIYNECKNDNGGKLADYIPQLSNIDHELFAICITTIDGKEIKIGDVDDRFCIQSCSKPLTYGVAIEDCGIEKVNQHIGFEPSGQSFNAFVFNEDNKPFNSLINSGAIVSTSLIQTNETEDKRFEYMMSVWEKVVGKNNVGFDNATYLSEKRTANRNRALSYAMMENGVFPDGIDIEKNLELYFQLCSLTMNCSSMSKYAAMLANKGISVSTNERVLSSEVVKNVLCVMYSAGMYDYSGRWAYHVGLPAKSGVSGCIMAVVPNMFGMCVYSPRLDKIGNSYRGIKVFEKLTSMYRLHIFDTGLDKKKDLFGTKGDIINEVFDTCKNNNYSNLEKLLYENDLDLNKGDYDKRCPLHIAVDEKSYECIELLMVNGADCNVKDRWDVSPLSKATELKDSRILGMLKK